MFSREIQLDSHDGPVTSTPRWLRIRGAAKYSGLGRSKLYELLSEGRIRSICVRSQKGAQHGVRLVDRESIRLVYGGPRGGVKCRAREPCGGRRKPLPNETTPERRVAGSSSLVCTPHANAYGHWRGQRRKMNTFPKSAV